MLKYPDNFNTPTFPAGPRIALSRIMAIGVMIAFALIIAVSGVILWASRSQQIHPFLVSVDNVTGAWSVIGHDHGERTISTNRAMQESVIADFTKNWYTISANQNENDDMWYGFAEKSECSADNRPDKAQLFCSSGEDLYNYFIYNIVPEYQERIAAGETWSVDVDNIYLSETADVTDSGGTWRILTQIDSSLYGPIPIMAYITLGLDMENYPGTLGFYVLDFNAYRMYN